MGEVVFISCGRDTNSRHLASHSALLGYDVYCGAPNQLIRDELCAAGVTPLTLDVACENSVADVAKTVLKAAGRVDHMLYTSHHNSFGFLEEHDTTDAHYQFHVNLFGAMRLLRVFGPFLRSQKSGSFTICSAGPIGAHLPTTGWHNACEAAIASIVNTARAEFGEFNVEINHLATGFALRESGSTIQQFLRHPVGAKAFRPMAQAAAARLSATTYNAETSEQFVEKVMTVAFNRGLSLKTRNGKSLGQDTANGYGNTSPCWLKAASKFKNFLLSS